MGNRHKRFPIFKVISDIPKKSSTFAPDFDNPTFFVLLTAQPLLATPDYPPDDMMAFRITLRSTHGDFFGRSGAMFHALLCSLRSTFVNTTDHKPDTSPPPKNIENKGINLFYLLPIRFEAYKCVQNSQMEIHKWMRHRSKIQSGICDLIKSGCKGTKKI